MILNDALIISLMKETRSNLKSKISITV